MEKKIKINYGISNKEKISLGEFEIESYDEIETVLVEIMEIISERNSLEKLTKIDITIEEIEEIKGKKKHIETIK